MVARALIIVLVNAAFLIGVLWYMPIEGLLSARGYTPEQIEALKSTGPEAPTPIPPPGMMRQSGDTPGAESTPAPAESAPAEAKPVPAESVTAPQPAQASRPEGEPATAQTAPAKPAEKAEPAPPQQLTATATINVRAGKSTQHRVVGQVESGDVVTVIEDPGGDWIRIEHGPTRGWAYRPLFEASDE